MDRRFLRPGWLVGHLLVVAAFLVCCRLGLWQWHRTHDADGTLQNLSYAILWPAFGIAFIYMWVRFLMLERAKDAADDRELDDGLAAILADGAGTESGPDAKGAAPVRPDPDGPGAKVDDASNDAIVPAPEIGADDEAGEDADAGTFVGTVEEIDEEEDPEMAAYNRALAALAERDEQRGN